MRDVREKNLKSLISTNNITYLPRKKNIRGNVN